MKAVYTEAATRKCSKPKALDKLEAIYLSLSEEEKALQLDRFADLFSFFTPKPASKKVKTPIEWVNLAVSKDETRYYLCASYSDGKYLVATDGHRLHRIENNLPKGYYDKLGNAIDLDGDFPEYERIFFDAKGKVEVTLDIEKASLEHHSKKWYYVFDVEGAEYGINKKYVDEALNGKKSVKGYVSVDVDFKAEKGESESDAKERRIRHIQFSPFQSQDTTFILMPCRLHNVRNT